MNGALTDPLGGSPQLGLETGRPGFEPQPCSLPVPSVLVVDGNCQVQRLALSPATGTAR